MNLLDNDILEQLYHLSSAVSFISDSTEVFRQSKTSLKKLIPSDDILIFFDDRERECLVAPGAFNLHPANISEEIIIPYDNAIAKEILISRQTMTRFEPDAPILPSMQSELFVPIISPEGVLGCLYFGRKDRVPFTVNEMMLAEHASCFIEMSVERLKWEDRWRRSKKITERWQEKYLSLLESIPFPAVVVDINADTFSEANEAFLKLVDMDRSILFEQKFSDICQAPDIMQRLELDSASSQGVAVIKNIEGETVKVDAHFSRLEAVSPINHLVVFQPIWSVEVQPADIDWLPHFLRACDVPPEADELQDVLLEPARIIADKFNAVFVTVHTLSPINDLLLKAAYKHEGDELRKPEEHFAAGLNVGPFSTILKSDKPLTIDNVAKEPSFVQWLPVARRVGYQSLVSVPIKRGDRILGILNVFCEKPRNWQQQEIHTLVDMAHILAFLIQDHNLKREVAEREKQIQAIGEITKTVNSRLDLEAVLQTAAAEMKKIIDFDYVGFTLFDVSGQGTRVFDLAVHDVVKKLGPNWTWDQIPDMDLGWIRRSLTQQTDSMQMQPARPEGMPNSMPAHTSVLLLSRNNYLGNCALGRLADRPFSRQDIQFLRQIAGQIAIAIENARLFQQVEQRVKEISALAHASRSITQSLKIDDILNNICDAVKGALKATLCTVTLFTDITDAEELFDWLPESLREHIAPDKMHQLIDKLETEGGPITFDSLEKFSSVLCSSDLGDEAMEHFRPFVISPIVHNEHLIACIISGWDTMRPIHESDLEILTTLAGQARSALLNANLYRSSLQKAEELESFVYSVSHDLKSPIQSMRSYTALIKEEYEKILPDGALQYLDRLSANLDQMEKLIMDLLELSRIGRGEAKFKEEEVSAIVQQALDSVGGLIANKNIKFVINESLPRIQCNKTLMVQLFTNLLSNAIKYTKNAEKPKIEIGFKELRSHYEFFVKDNGIGIAPELHEKIFELFHTQTSDDDLSTGVGLAIVKKVVELHRGKVWVESEPGKGATFRFTIPKKYATAEFPHNGFSWSTLSSH